MQPVLARLAAGLGLALVAGALLAVGVALLLVALYLWLDRVFDPATAALITGLTTLLLAVAVLLAARIATRRPSSKRRADAAPAALAAALGAQAGDLARAQARAGIRGRGGEGLLIALAAGFALGISPKLRRSILRWLG